MTVSSYGLLILVPLFICTFGGILGASYDEVIAHFSRPFPAIVSGLTIAVGFMHFKNGARALIEDYMSGFTREFWIIAISILSYAAAATGIGKY